MGIRVVAIYRPKPDMATELAAITEIHVPALRELGLASDAPALVLRAPDGTLLEAFEWVDQAAIDAAHEHPEVHKIWARFGECSEFGTLAELPNATTPFPEFDYVGTY